MSQSWFKFYPKGVPEQIDEHALTDLASTLETACKRFGPKPALTCLNTTITYRQFDRMADALAAYLQNVVGLQKGDRIAIMLPNVFQLPITFFAAQKIGLICVNTNPLYTPREMKHQFKDSGAKAIVILDMFLDKLEEIIDETDIKAVISTGIGDQLPAWKGAPLGLVMRFKGLVPKTSLEAVSFVAAVKEGGRLSYVRPDIDKDDVALLQYTGGTTGVSKGAMLTHRNILANMFQIKAWADAYIQEGHEMVLTAIPLYHIFALTVNFLTFVNMGQHMILVPKPVPIENTAKIFKKYTISVMTGVNTLFNALNNNKEFKAIAPRSVKFALAGGMALQESVSEAWAKITGNRVVQGYGLTESSPVTHVNPLDGGDRPGSIGVPVPSTLARVVDEAGNEVPIGETGELIVQGPQVMKGYWQRPDETAKVLKKGWLYTGDMAKRDEDGFFYIVDRKKDMILVSGFNVYPNEVEAVIASHPKVLEAAVIGIPDNNSGEAVKAFVVRKDDSLTSEELAAYCREQLTGYKRPRFIEFRSDLPKTNVGKILRRELRDGSNTGAEV